MGWSVIEFYLGYDSESGFHHLHARLEGDTEADALAGARHLYKSFGEGNACFMRAKPEARTEVDYETGKKQHRGWVRFSYKDEPGETRYSDRSADIVYVGFGEMKGT